MGDTSIVTAFINLVCWMAFGIGIPFNAILIWLIVRHTPPQMRIYSKILLQTCLVDILLIVMTFLFFPCNFVTANGETEAILYGLVTIRGAENRIWNTLAFVCWVFLVYVSMFGYVSQFIFRYFVLVRDKNISTPKYFLLLFLMLLFPFGYCLNLFICYFPPANLAVMNDKSVAQILGINLDDQIVLAGYSLNDVQQTFGFYYIITVCTIAYIIIFTFAYRIEMFLEKKSKISVSSAVAKKMVEINKQVSRNLIVQASMPLIIYLSVLFFLGFMLLKIDTTQWVPLQYYNLVSSIFQFGPSALNPIVSIWALRYYRDAFVSEVKCLLKYVKRLLLCQHPPPVVAEQPQHQQKRWAISVINRE